MHCSCTSSACLCHQVYGPQNLGKLSAGGHPRRLAQDQEQPQSEQNGVQTGSQNGVQANPNEKHLTQQQQQHQHQHQQQEQQQQQQDNSPDKTQASAQVVSQNQVSQGQISKEQLSQVQHSQEQHSQAGVKEQAAGGVQGSAGQATQAVPIRKADCFATFNPPTVEEYQAVWLMMTTLLCMTYRLVSIHVIHLP